MAKTFKGGIHVPSSKNTKDSPIVDFPPPKIVSIPLSQHIGAPAAPLVSKGDAVSVGQIIGYTPSGLSCPVHASVSGVVKDVENAPVIHRIRQNGACHNRERLSKYLA